MTFYISYDNYQMQERLQFSYDFQDFLVYRNYLEGCQRGQQLLNKKVDYWECVRLSYIQKKEFQIRMKGKRK